MIKIYCDGCGKEIDRKQFDTKNMPITKACTVSIRCEGQHISFCEDWHLCYDCQKLVENNFKSLIKTFEEMRTK